jgi:hypothetical protein
LHCSALSSLEPSIQWALGSSPTTFAYLGLVSGQTFTHELPGTAAAVSTGLDLALPERQVAFTLAAGYARGDEGEELTATGGLRLWW